MNNKVSVVVPVYRVEKFLNKMVPTKIYRTDLAKKVEFPEGFIHKDVYWLPMILHMASHVVVYNI